MALRSISQLKSWFKKGMYPTESQFGDWLDSFFHRDDKIPVGSVDGLNEAINSKAEQSAIDTLSQNISAISTKADGASSVASSALNDAKKVLSDVATAQATAQQAIADAAAAITTLRNGVAPEGDTLAKLYAKIQTLKAIVASPDVNLDTVQKIVTFIKNNKDVIDSIATNKVNISDIVDNLLSTDINRPLSANQGKVLKDLLDTLTTSVGNKVDKVVGKQLSTEDFTTEEKQKLAQQSGVNTGDQDLSGLQIKTEKNQANGYAGLDGLGKIPTNLLPSYVDDVLEFASFAALPTTGESGKIYVTTDSNKQYRWSGSAYIEITSGAVQSVNGKTGIVVLDKSDIGLRNVDNTTDASKQVLSANKLATARKINHVNFDGTEDITIPTLESLQKFQNSTKDINIDLSTSIYKINVTSNAAITLNINTTDAHVLSNSALTVEIHINMVNVSTITWPTNVSWLEGSAPVMNSVGIYGIAIRTMDAGVSWSANLFMPITNGSAGGSEVGVLSINSVPTPLYTNTNPYEMEPSTAGGSFTTVNFTTTIGIIDQYKNKFICIGYAKYGASSLFDVIKIASNTTNSITFTRSTYDVIKSDVTRITSVSILEPMVLDDKHLNLIYYNLGYTETPSLIELPKTKINYSVIIDKSCNMLIVSTDDTQMRYVGENGNAHYGYIGGGHAILPTGKIEIDRMFDEDKFYWKLQYQRPA